MKCSPVTVGFIALVTSLVDVSRGVSADTRALPSTPAQQAFVSFAMLSELRATLFDVARFRTIEEIEAIRDGARLVRKFIQNHFNIEPTRSVVVLSVNMQGAAYQMFRSHSLVLSPLSWTSDDCKSVLEFLRWYEASSDFIARSRASLREQPLEIAVRNFELVAKNPLLSDQQVVAFQGAFVNRAAQTTPGELAGLRLESETVHAVRVMVRYQDQLKYYAAKAEQAAARGKALSPENVDYALRALPNSWVPATDAAIPPSGAASP